MFSTEAVDVQKKLSVVPNVVFNCVPGESIDFWGYHSIILFLSGKFNEGYSTFNNKSHKTVAGSKEKLVFRLHLDKCRSYSIVLISFELAIWDTNTAKTQH